LSGSLDEGDGSIFSDEDKHFRKHEFVETGTVIFGFYL
jgi:hypothetical protein